MQNRECHTCIWNSGAQVVKINNEERSINIYLMAITERAIGVVGKQTKLTRRSSRLTADTSSCTRCSSCITTSTDAGSRHSQFITTSTPLRGQIGWSGRSQWCPLRGWGGWGSGCGWSHCEVRVQGLWVAYSGSVVGSKSSVVVGGSSSRDSVLDGGVGELLVGQGKTRVNEGRQLMLMVDEENLCA